MKTHQCEMQRDRLVYLLLWLMICYFVALTNQQNFEDEDYSLDQETSYFKKRHDILVIRKLKKNELSLTCMVHKNKTIRNQGIRWEFKPCDTNYKGVVNCDSWKAFNSSDLSWQEIPSKKNHNKLTVVDLNETNNGLYRCFYNDKIKKAFLVELTDALIYKHSPPKVEALIISNTTNQLYQEITILCNISSTAPAKILWFNGCKGAKYHVQFDNGYYCYLNVTSMVYNSGNTYVSKLNVFNAKDTDSDVYTCLAISAYGKDLKSVTVQVSLNANTSEWFFTLLFLIPIAFILLPMAVWLCYYKQKKLLLQNHKLKQKRLTECL